MVERIEGLIPHFEILNFYHIHRSCNTQVDGMANFAIYLDKGVLIKNGGNPNYF